MGFLKKYARLEHISIQKELVERANLKIPDA
jgi:hypothetical protein